MCKLQYPLLQNCWYDNPGAGVWCYHLWTLWVHYWWVWISSVWCTWHVSVMEMCCFWCVHWRNLLQDGTINVSLLISCCAIAFGVACSATKLTYLDALVFSDFSTGMGCLDIKSAGLSAPFLYSPQRLYGSSLNPHPSIQAGGFDLGLFHISSSS